MICRPIWPLFYLNYRSWLMVTKKKKKKFYSYFSLSPHPPSISGRFIVMFILWIRKFFLAHNLFLLTCPRIRVSILFIIYLFYFIYLFINHFTSAGFCLVFQPCFLLQIHFTLLSSSNVTFVYLPVQVYLTANDSLFELRLFLLWLLNDFFL